MVLRYWRILRVANSRWSIKKEKKKKCNEISGSSFQTAEPKPVKMFHVVVTHSL